MSDDLVLMILATASGLVMGVVAIAIVTVINHKIAQKRHKEFLEYWKREHDGQSD